MNLNPLLKAICPHSKNQQAKKDKELNKIIKDKKT
jgi:hypothetical protein